MYNINYISNELSISKKKYDILKIINFEFNIDAIVR